MEGTPRCPRFGPQSHWVAGPPGPSEGSGPDPGVEASHYEGDRRRDLVQPRARQGLSGSRRRVIVPAMTSYYTRPDKRKSYCFHQIAFSCCLLDRPEGTWRVHRLLRGPAGALTLIRKRRRIKEPYRINDIG